MIRGEKVRLRPLEPEDSPALQRWMNDPEVTRWLVRRTPTSVDDERRRLEGLQKSDRLDLAIETLDGELIGHCSLMFEQMDREATLTIAIGEKAYWSGGYGTDAMIALCRYGFTQLNLHRIQLAVFPGNERAVRCYEKVGFVHENRRREVVYHHGGYDDLLGMSLLSHEFAARYGP